MFIGEYRHNLDSKKRLIVPSEFRKELGDKFTVTKGNEGCLRIYTESEWKKEEEMLARLPQTNKAARQYTRFITSGALAVDCDGQGRIQLSTPLVEYADLSKNCVIVGANQYVEIWNENRWKEYIDDTIDNIDEVTESLTEFFQ